MRLSTSQADFPAHHCSTCRRARRSAALLCLLISCGLAACRGDINTGGDSPDSGTTPPLQVQPVWQTAKREMGEVRGLTAKDQTLYVSADTGIYLFALGATSANLTCSLSTEKEVAAPATIDSAGNAYFTRNHKSCLGALDVTTCQPKWDYLDCGAESDTRPVLLPSGSEVVVATAADTTGAAYLRAVNTEDGKETWNLKLEEASVFRSLIGSSDGTLYVGLTGSGKGTLHRITSPYDALPTDPFFTATGFKAPALVASDGKVIIGAWNQKVYAVDQQKNVPWECAVQDGHIVTAPVEFQGKIYITAWLDGIYARDLAGSGLGNWARIHEVKSINTSGVAVDETGTLYVGGESACDPKSSSAGGGCLYAFRDGKQLWAFETIDPVDATPLVHNGLVIAGDKGGSLYAFKTGAEQTSQ